MSDYYLVDPFVSATREDGVWILGMSDSETHPATWVIFQAADEDLSEEYALGMGGIHLSAQPSGAHGYELVRRLSFADGVFVVHLSDLAARDADNPTVELKLADGSYDPETLAVFVRHMNANQTLFDEYKAAHG